jgi:hypothetical protein
MRNFGVDRPEREMKIDPEIEEAWAAEVEARIQAILSGESETLSGPEVIARIRARYDR